MKNKNIFTVVIEIGFSFLCFSQVESVKRERQLLNQNQALQQVQNRTPAINQETTQDQTKTLLKEVTNEVNKYLNDGKINEAIIYINKNRLKCNEFKDNNLCASGLNFTSGYLFQQAALKDKVKSKIYQIRAVIYYEKVLEIYPDNKAVWSNLIKLKGVIGVRPSIINKMLKRAEKYPAERVDYLLHIGDLYKLDNKFNNACFYYNKAYEEDPFSKQACRALVELYTNNTVHCDRYSDIRKFAADCDEIGFPKYSEELLQKEIILAYENKAYDKVLESLVLWANVLAENRWLDSGQVSRLYKKLFPDDSNLASSLEIRRAITELQMILKIENVNQLDTQFWKKYSPRVYVSNSWDNISPFSVLFKILHAKGQNAYFRGDLINAESFWKTALKDARYFDKAYFTVIASDLALLYNANPRFDPENKKLDSLIIDLFDEKGSAYRKSDYRLIRQYHITLGSIFYDKKIWGGLGAKNARFQLSRALWSDFGPIVNPKLRSMLGDVYDNLNKSGNAIKAYTLALQDYLLLDKLKEASTLQTDVKERFGSIMSQKQSKSLDVIGEIINWRYRMYNLNNETEITKYLIEATSLKVNASDVFSEEFVNSQLFKGLADSGSLLPADRLNDKQILFVNALSKIENMNSLSSSRDYTRIKNIKIALEENVEQSKQLEKTQMKRKGDLTYTSSRTRTDFKTYNIPTLNKEIIVPNQLFELTKTMSDYYVKDNNIKLAKFKLQDGKFIKQNN